MTTCLLVLTGMQRTIDDWTVIQRDLKVNGGLIPAREEEVVEVRNKAARALQALFKALGLPPITDQEVEAATYANGSKDNASFVTRLQILKAAQDLLNRGGYRY